MPLFPFPSFKLETLLSKKAFPNFPLGSFPSPSLSIRILFLIVIIIIFSGMLFEISLLLIIFNLLLSGNSG